MNAKRLDLDSVAVRLAELRRQRDLTLSALAEKTGYSVSHLSQIERGQSVPSLSALAAVASALRMELTDFFDDGSEPLITVTKADNAIQARSGSADSSAPQTYAILGGLGGSSGFSSLIHGLPPQEHPVDFRHFGERFALVLDGEVRLIVNGDTFDLLPGDFIHYAATSQHSAHNRTADEVAIFWITCPAIL